jgi:hypothetical protein
VLEAIGGDEAANAALQRRYRTEAAAMSYPATAGRPQPGPLRFADASEFATQVQNNLLFFYRYGAAFLEMIDQRLRRDHGTDLLPLLQAWYAEHTGGAVTTEAFRDFVVARTGDDRFGRLFEEWATRGPAPTIELGGYSYEAGVVRFTVRRTGGADQDLGDLEVAVDLGTEVHRLTAALPSGTDAVTLDVELDSAPSVIAVDPLGFYVLRLQTEAGWSGPGVQNVLP